MKYNEVFFLSIYNAETNKDIPIISTLFIAEEGRQDVLRIRAASWNGHYSYLLEAYKPMQNFPKDFAVKEREFLINSVISFVENLSADEVKSLTEDRTKISHDLLLTKEDAE